MCGFLCVFRAFLVVRPLFQCLLLFAILAAPSIFPFQFVPLFQCVFHTFLVVRPLSSCIRLSCLGTSSFFTAFALPFLSLLCVRLLTHALYFPCVPFIPVPFPLCRPFCPSYLRPWAFRSPCACFQPRCPHLPSAIPPFPHRLSLLFLLRSRVFLPLFSAPFLSFVFHLEKSFPLNRG